ncbi:hypothetical protein HYZ82_01660 [Candidatus Nomurabacteria bacterium]|nr:hypothetical protein [Candidatus Nomurabacteria bacterium]
MKILKLELKNWQKGYAILELLFYMSFFLVISIVVIDSMIIMTKTFKETSIQRDLTQGGVIMERISREMRQAYDISAISASDLTLNTTDIFSGADETVQFLLSGSDIQLLENAALTGNLNLPNVAVAGLSFTQITTVSGKAIKILLTVRSTNDALNRTADFYDTVVLRGSYN